jgi:hypothetical protein
MTAGLSSVVSDPSLNGWATFLVYLVAAWLCARNARSSAALAEAGGRRIAEARSRRRFWLVLAVLLLLLGLTRQLDLQQLAANMMRALFRSEGIYGERSGLQLGLIVAIGVFGTVGLLIALLSLRRAEPSVLAALLGAATLVLFTVIRTISLHDIDQFLNRGVGLPRLRVNSLIELGLLALVVIAGFVFDRGLKREGESARLRTLSLQERQRMLAEKRRSARS